MWRIKKTVYINGAHWIEGYKGKCNRLHGHRWKVEVEIEGEGLNKEGMVFDFLRIKGIIEKYDHQCLNDIGEGELRQYPTAENFAKRIFQDIKEEIKEREEVKIKKVKVWETEDAMVEYYE